MLGIFQKEINTFFSSLIGYIVIGVFLIILGLVMFVFPDTSLLNYNYATLDQLFEIAPLIFIFLIPAICMRSFAEEQQNGTLELLTTKPVSDLQIVLGKYLACLALVVFALLPTLLYYYTVYQLGSPKGNLDAGAIGGSYIGLFFLAACFVSIGLFASSLTNNQIVAFLLATFLCFFIYWGFDFMSRLPVFVGKVDDVVQMIGLDYHYQSISRGVLDTRDVVYFLSLIAFFVAACLVSLGRRKW
ncbi:MAG TPA: gliding motility-associated ABC transporter permease subunit GldF [Saprospiraceae bacterium]|nr:gliding motility-associated ABC transporter permease subunit GldF [Saprospiraceae bacterium]HMQ84294.1 gliding motility-associated ABC transporter permease subunit GldF [Saprospiraceae bacterium]